MPFWPWSQELEVGIRQIDEQHKWLVDLTNQLHDLIEDGADRETISQFLDALMDYTMYHFIVEEELFQRLGYPETEGHCRAHGRFTEQIMSLIERHDAGEAVGVEALELLKGWLEHHILKVDKAYVDHFRAHGVG